MRPMIDYLKRIVPRRQPPVLTTIKRNHGKTPIHPHDRCGCGKQTIGKCVVMGCLN